MTEHDIYICGHGSGCPSRKVMFDYLENRRLQKAGNGVDKGLVCVVRFLTTAEQEKAFKEGYTSILGRNIYSQNLRQYVYTTKNGKYYSDCSSSGCYTYDLKCGVKGVKDYNTAAMYRYGKQVDVRIENGHIVESDLRKLHVGDALLFRGNDASRPLQIGHVEYIYELPSVNGTWIRNPDSTWSYSENGSLVKNDWRLINHHWYWFHKSGIMATGWQKVDGKDYYFQESDADNYDGALWHGLSDGSQERWDMLF